MSYACLYIVATPIGNRDDFSRRAIDILKSVDVIAAEDTRHSKRLLDYYQINTPLMSLHQHNESQRISSVVSRLEKGQKIALISDAGTPLISDPGYRLVAELQKRHFRIVPIPGACAAITALCASGLPTDRFVFEGFLPVKKGTRQNYLRTLLNEPRTLIFYESKHRILDSLTDICHVFGPERRAVLARELTKSFETIRQDSLAALLAWVRSDPNQLRGEFVIVLAGVKVDGQQVDQTEAKRILSILLKELPLKQAVAIATDLTNGQRKSLYQLALLLKSEH